jgi:hypothetical protein
MPSSGTLPTGVDPDFERIEVVRHPRNSALSEEQTNSRKDYKDPDRQDQSQEGGKRS